MTVGIGLPVIAVVDDGCDLIKGLEAQPICRGFKFRSLIPEGRLVSFGVAVGLARSSRAEVCGLTMLSWRMIATSLLKLNPKFMTETLQQNSNSSKTSHIAIH